MDPRENFCRACQQGYTYICACAEDEDYMSDSLKLIDVLHRHPGLSWSYINPHYVQVYDSKGQLSVSSYRALMALHALELEAPTHAEVWAALEEASVGYLHASGELSSVDLEKFYADQQPW